MSKKPIIIKLGGSVLAHSHKLFDFNFLREFRDLLQEQVLSEKRFIVVVGGGETSRKYVEYAQTEGNIQNETDQHWIGAAVNTLHGYLLKAFLGENLAGPNILKFDDEQRLDKIELSAPITVAGGFRPGISSDGVALSIAKHFSAEEIYNLKGIDGVYSADPKTDEKAQLIDSMNWEEYLDIIGNPESHKPGANYPIDAVAARDSQKLNITYKVLKANDLSNFEKALLEQPFTGTTIHG